MANRKKKHTLDNILPERRDSYDSFYKAINHSDSVSKESDEDRYDAKKVVISVRKGLAKF